MLKYLSLLMILGVMLVGCQKDTNVITPETVDAANKHRIEVIDKDPSMTADQKQKMKQALRLVPGGPPGSGTAGGPGAAQGRGR